MAVKGISVFYCVAGGLILYSGIKGATIQETVRGVLTGNLSLSNSEPIKGTSTAPASTSSSTGATASGAAGVMLNYMRQQAGKPYSEDTTTNPATGQEKRFGPQEFDCSGLVYAASHQARTGINLPASQAIASSEAEWFAALSGASVIKTASSVQVGDLMFFTGANPNSSSFGPIGHVGICSSPGTLLSAYDTARGVTYTPVSQDHFVVAVRL